MHAYINEPDTDDLSYAEEAIEESWADDEEMTFVEYDEINPARRWTLKRVIVLFFVLILIAAVLVFVVLPVIESLLRGEPPRLQPPVNA